MSYVVTDGPDLNDPAIVGHKFARQSELRAAGFPVPEFYCISGAAFDATVGALAVRPRPGPGSGEREVLRWAEEMRARIVATGVDRDLAAEVLLRLDELAPGGAPVAVRACAVAARDGHGEDGADDPFAGLSDSFLYVGRDDVLHRVSDCWASAYSERAVLYRMHRGTDPLSVSIAVGVQRMVPAPRSFVAFTRDPVNGSGRCLIAAAYGVGEGVVQEKADVDHFYVDMANGAVDARVLSKTRMIGLDAAHPAAGPVLMAVPKELAGAPVLTDEEARHIAGLTRRVETHFGAPQDIEGAMTSDGEVMLVQARPIVGAAAAQREEPRAAERVAPDREARTMWTVSNVTEGFPGVSGALTYTVAAQYGEATFGDFYRRMGVPEPALRARSHDLRRLLGYLNGRICARVDTWYGLHSQLPSFASLRTTWEPALGLPRTAGESAGRVGLLAGRLRRVAQYAGLAARLPRHRARIRAFLRWWDDFYAPQDDVDPAERSTDRLVEDYHAMWAEVGRRWGLASVNNFHLLLISRLTNTLVGRWLPGVGSSTLTGMLCGGRENRSTAAVRSAIDLAERAARSPALRSAVMEGDERQVWQDMLAGQHGQEFRAAAIRHVRRYGDRSLRDLKLETVTLRQEPWALIATLRAYVAESLTVDANRDREREARAQAERELAAHCRNPVRRAILRVCYAIMRDLFRSREDTRFCRSQLFGVSRTLLLGIGERLVEAGRLEHPRDIFDLTVQEILGAYEGTLPGADLEGLVRVRRAQRAEWERDPDLPMMFGTDPGLPLAAELERLDRVDPVEAGSTAQRLTGIGSSAGRVRARAKVILDPTTIDVSECRGHILVARETDPGWLFLMMAAKGIIVEHGSPVSHAAITGRMLAIPTVVAVATATSRIRDGDWVELDGTTGTVILSTDTLTDADADSDANALAGEGALA